VYPPPTSGTSWHKPHTCSLSLIDLPQYFTLSGLRTNLGLLNNGITWGYTILICVFAFISKFFACAIAARLFGFNLRESSAIGSLMSCKG
jgi:Kef-type K+ transport system membrane component KefB